MTEKEKYLEIYNGEIGKEYARKRGEGYGRLCWGQNIVPYFKSLNPKSVLDVGCGYGRFCDIVADFTDVVYGCDIASVATGNIIQNEKIKYIDCEAKSIPLLDQSVEWVTSFDCLEHCLIDDIPIILQEFSRICTRGFIFSIAYCDDEYNGLKLHMTVQSEDWWLNAISQYGKIERHGLIEYVNNPYIICHKT
jgi:ubiquinone/menaquinone biosynthesis C-methylase UbiE